MLFSSILNMEFEDIGDEPDVYTDKARRICTMSAEEVDGFGTGYVTAFFDLITGKILTVNERIENTDIDTLMRVEDRVNEFNAAQNTYVATYQMSDDANYIDINVTTQKFSKVIDDALG